MFFPEIELAEATLASHKPLAVREAHMALTNRAFEPTPAAKLGNRPVREEELVEYKAWQNSKRVVSDRSALLMLGIR